MISNGKLNAKCLYGCRESDIVYINVENIYYQNTLENNLAISRRVEEEYGPIMILLLDKRIL